MESLKIILTANFLVYYYYLTPPPNFYFLDPLKKKFGPHKKMDPPIFLLDPLQKQNVLTAKKRFFFDPSTIFFWFPFPK